MRGSNTYGHGIKGRRGKGRKGGKGLPGIGKHHWSYALKHPEYLWGNHGFTSHHPKDEVIIMNVGTLSETIDELVEKKLALYDGDKYEVNLEILGVNKLLGKGRVDKKMVVHVKYASESAKSKIQGAGGEVLNA
jgi:large subunit ribosomal protein L15